MVNVNRFLIGQYGAFDDNKYRRDFRQGFYGIEACIFEREEDIERLRSEARQHGFRIGVHYPLRAGRARVRDALFLSNDEAVRTEALAIIRQELAYMKAIELHPSYVLFHYPKPVILDERADWRSWRFDDPSEYVLEGDYSRLQFQENSEALFAGLSKLANEYAFTAVLEFDALNRYVYDSDDLARWLDRYTNIKLCLDTARLYLQERIDPHFDARAVIQRYAQYAALVHLSNVQINDSNQIVKSRQPVLPTLDPNDGWAPIEDYLRLIRERNSHVNIMFEHRSEQVSDEELSLCYRWVQSLV